MCDRRLGRHHPWDGRIALVVPTLGRASFGELVRSLAEAHPDPRIRLDAVVVVDDRTAASTFERHEPSCVAAAWLEGRAATIERRSTGGRGRAAARAVGIASTTTPWVVVLDDEITVTPDWWRLLADDVGGAAPDTAAVVGRRFGPRRNPEPASCTPGPGGTADLALRRSALDTVGDRRGDLLGRLVDAGWQWSVGEGTIASRSASDRGIRTR